mmetsp:Transcript_71381/g.125677  ORF Transcript_71381/g.125677 Transcript_71381/m.125677 type:complete len:93 (+) Transcript_71381:157-435(+)
MNRTSLMHMHGADKKVTHVDVFALVTQGCNQLDHCFAMGVVSTDHGARNNASCGHSTRVLVLDHEGPCASNGHVKDHCRDQATGAVWVHGVL